MNWQQLTNAELARHADLAQDPLTTTELEKVLLERFTELVGIEISYTGITEVLDEFSVDFLETSGIEQVRDALQFQYEHDNLKNVRALLDTLALFDIDTPEALRKQLDRLSKFDQVMQDLADPITTLQTLVTTE